MCTRKAAEQTRRRKWPKRLRRWRVFAAIGSSRLQKPISDAPAAVKNEGAEDGYRC